MENVTLPIGSMYVIDKVEKDTGMIIITACKGRTVTSRINYRVSIALFKDVSKSV